MPLRRLELTIAAEQQRGRRPVIRWLAGPFVRENMIATGFDEHEITWPKSLKNVARSDPALTAADQVEGSAICVGKFH